MLHSFRSWVSGTAPAIVLVLLAASGANPQAPSANEVELRASPSGTPPLVRADDKAIYGTHAHGGPKAHPDEHAEHSGEPTRGASRTTVDVTLAATASPATAWPFGPQDVAEIQGDVAVPYDVAVAGIRVRPGGRLVFPPDKSVTIQSSGNVVIEGNLSMRPSSAAVMHTLRFVGINESKFVGGGMDPVPSDIGLWVMGAGTLDLAGTPKSSWVRATGGVAKGATSLTLDAAPVGWQPGDEVSIAPTESPGVGPFSWAGFDVTALSSVSGATVSFTGGVGRAHPMVNGRWTAEVMNLTRNVRLEGTATGRSHVFIRSSAPQSIRHVALRYMGPRKDQNGDGYSDLILGRYGLHFHHSGEGSRGSVVEGTVMRDQGSHAYVPHQSHGVTFRDCVGYDITEDAFWWDLGPDTRTPGPKTDDTLVDHCIMALVRSVPHFRGYRLSGFVLGMGDRNVIRNSVAVGVQGNADAAGFLWPEDAGQKSTGVWGFSEGNVTHNNKVDGIFVWQNTSLKHVVAGFASYHNGGFGIDHGAYANNYQFTGAHVYGNLAGAVSLHALSGGAPGAGLRFENMVLDGAGLSDTLVTTQKHTLTTQGPVLFCRVTMTGSKSRAVLAASAGGPPDVIDIAYSTIASNEFYLNSNINPASVIRVQPDATSAFALRRYDQPGTLVPKWNARRQAIAAFAAC